MDQSSAPTGGLVNCFLLKERASIVTPGAEQPPGERSTWTSALRRLAAWSIDILNSPSQSPADHGGAFFCLWAGGIERGIFAHTSHRMGTEERMVAPMLQLKWPFWVEEDEEREPDPRETLEESLEHTRVLLAQAYTGFNFAADPELVESYVYEIQALQTRYSYLLRQRKALEAAPAALPQ